jgi:hypothetical protein
VPVETPSKDPPNYRDVPTYWFVRLEIAVERGDHAAAAEAQRQLDRLGVRVAYGLPRSPAERVERGGRGAFLLQQTRLPRP